MWTIRKTTTADRQDRQRLDPLQRRALMRVWDGTAEPGDFPLVRSVIESAREAKRWIACDCRSPAEGDQALMAPAYLRTHRTHYLRRLYGRRRMLHDQSCPFYGEPALGHDRMIEATSPDRPEGYFAVPDPATAPMRGEIVLIPGLPPLTPEPRLGDDLLRRQLWRLMERARLDLLSPPVSGRKPSFTLEYAALRDAAEELHVAYGVPLARVLETVPTAFERKSIYAKIRQAARQRSGEVDGDRADPLQGWVCTFARRASRDEIGMQMKGRAITLRPEHGVDVLPGHGPYLCLVCVSPDRKGNLRPARAVAQPIHSMRRFFPIFHDTDRALLDALVAVQFAVRRADPDLALGFSRALFGLPGDAAPGRLSCLMTDGRTGTLHELSWSAAELAGMDPLRIADRVQDWAMSRSRIRRRAPVAPADR